MLTLGLDYEAIMQVLKDAGLYSLPGGGAEFSTMSAQARRNENAPPRMALM